MTIRTYQLSDDQYLRFQKLVLNHSGLHFPEQKRSDLEIGLFKALENAPVKITNIDEYHRFLSETASSEAQTELNRLMRFLTVGETHFFRNDGQFDALKNHILPELIRLKRTMVASGHSHGSYRPRLRLWSAGCATGEEPYSLAILLRELIPDIANWHILILATDINEDFLTRAHHGLYSAWSFREPQAIEMRSRYFAQQGGRYRLRDEIRQMVTFVHHNLVANDFPALSNNTNAMDLIICRNVMIYFDNETAHALINKFYETLVDGGWLVIGHSEPSMTMYRKFQVQMFPHALLYQRTGQPTVSLRGWQWADETDQPSPIVIDSPKKSPTAVFIPETETPPLRQTKRQTDALTLFRQTHLPAPSPTEHVHTPEIPAGVEAYRSVQQLLNQGHIDQALATLKSVENDLTDHQLAHAYVLLANAYADTGHWQQARYWCEQSFALDPLIPEAYFILAMIDEHEGEVEQAITNLKKVIYLDQKRPLSHFNLAMLYIKIDQRTQAQRALTNAQKILINWPPEKTIPDSGGANAQRLLRIVQHMLADFENKNFQSDCKRPQ